MPLYGQDVSYDKQNKITVYSIFVSPLYKINLGSHRALFLENIFYKHYVRMEYDRNINSTECL